MPKHEKGFEVIDEDLDIMVLEDIPGETSRLSSSTYNNQQSTPSSQQSTPSSQQLKPNPEQLHDLIVVGAGVSGLYCLYNILKHNPEFTKGKKKFMILEQSTIPGGRLRTDIIDRDSPIKDSNDHRFIACEEGGMRFCKLQQDNQHEDADKSNEVMPRLLNLIQDLKDDAKKHGIIVNLDTRQFKMKPEGTVDFRRMWFNGSGFTQWYAQQNMDVYSERFFLGPKERGKAPGEIYKEVYVRVLRENRARLISLVGRDNAEIVINFKQLKKVALIQTTDYWSHFRQYFTWNDIEMNKYTFNSLMTVMGYTQGCIEMLQKTGFQCFTMGRGNAGTIIQMDRTHAAISGFFYAFQCGFESLTDTLVEVISAMLGRPKDEWLTISSRLIEITPPAKKGRVTQLDVVDISEDTSSCNKITSYKAQEVILAIPRKAFDRIAIKTDSYCKVKDFAGLINSVVDVNMTKINLYFYCERNAKPGTNAWWNEGQGGNRLFGPSNTSLHVAQIYPWYEQTWSPLDDPLPEKELCALTIYCDVENSGFWSDLQALPGKFTSPLQKKYNQLVPASLAVVEEAYRELEMLFNVKHIPGAVLTTYTQWAGGPDTKIMNPVAIHQWKRGTDEVEVRDKLVKPWENAGVYVCNEAWSGFQGWVEGSLMSADAVLANILPI